MPPVAAVLALICLGCLLVVPVLVWSLASATSFALVARLEAVPLGRYISVRVASSPVFPLQELLRKLTSILFLVVGTNTQTNEEVAIKLVSANLTFVLVIMFSFISHVGVFPDGLLSHLLLFWSARFPLFYTESFHIMFFLLVKIILSGLQRVCLDLLDFLYISLDLASWIS